MNHCTGMPPVSLFKSATGKTSSEMIPGSCIINLLGYTLPSNNMDPPHALYILQLQIASHQF